MDSEVKIKRYKKKRKIYVENNNNMNRLFFSKMWHFILGPPKRKTPSLTLVIVQTPLP